MRISAKKLSAHFLAQFQICRTFDVVVRIPAWSWSRHCHRRAAFVALAAALEAQVHVTNLLVATVRACLADCCGCFADMGVIVAVAGHEIDPDVASGYAFNHPCNGFHVEIIAAFLTKVPTHAFKNLWELRGRHEFLTHGRSPVQCYW